MKYFGDYHTHTNYSDGRSTLQQNIESALTKGLQELAITDHGFTSPSWGALNKRKFQKQQAQIAAARQQYGNKLKIMHGMEADIVGLDGGIGLSEDDIAKLDILLLGYHSFAKAQSFGDWKKIFGSTYVSMICSPSKATIARNTATLINAIKRHPIDIISHINLLFKVDCFEVAKACSDYGTYIELNAKYMNMTAENFQKMTTTGVKFIANSDAHHYSSIGKFEKIELFLSQNDYPLENLANYKKAPQFLRKK